MEGGYRCAKILVGEKKRDITVYTPDALHHQRVLLARTKRELQGRVHPSAYGYVEGKSTWTAAQEIMKRKKKYKYYLVCDIKSFFPSIDRVLLAEMLDSSLKAQDADALMRYASCCKKGIAQGSPLSPILSNFYLHDVDHAVTRLPRTLYLRYADDILILSDNTKAALDLIKTHLDRLNLQLSEKKIFSGTCLQRFEFLGFEFSVDGLHISRKKQQEMNMKMNLASPDERKTVYQGYQAYFRNTSLLHPDADTLPWVLRYGSLIQAANYIRAFSGKEWMQAQAVLEQFENDWKMRTSISVSSTMGRAFHKESIHIAG